MTMLPTGQRVTIRVSHSFDPVLTGKFMAVVVFAEGVHIVDHELGPGDAWEFHVGAEYKAYMERIPNVAYDAEVYLAAAPGNIEPVQVAYQSALAGNDVAEVFWLAPGAEWEVNPVVTRRWEISAETWGT